MQIWKDNRPYLAQAIERINELKAENERLREALEAAVNYVPDLKDVPGIKAALRREEEQEDTE